jgi:acyl-CoA reductase-like NAD-dependent aldehyde dehydrogenase
MTEANLLLSRFARLQQAARNDLRAAPAPDAAYASYDSRAQRLRALERVLRAYAPALVEAVSADFGHRAPAETRLLELFPSQQAIAHALGQLRRWMRPQRRHVALWFQPGCAEVRWQPLGAVGIIVPWNYPIYLAVGPLTAALAAGNRVLVKMSEFTPRTAGVFAEMIGEAFADDEVGVVQGDASVAHAFSQLPFDHLLFTGSTAVGHHVMRAAAENLTPVTLELGGKSPAIIGPAANFVHAVERIVVGKTLNAGQTCIAPDYVLLPRGREDEFVDLARRVVARAYPELGQTADYTHIVDARHFERLAGYVSDACAQGASAVELAPGVPADAATRRFSPLVLRGVTAQMRVMNEEIFGPLLPLVGYRDLDEAIAFVNARPRPLALYYFDTDAQAIARVLDGTVSGGVTVNDTLLHVAQDALPFGGVGPSGMGRYHGFEGFATFSAQKSVFRQSRLSGIGLFKPPYGARFEKLMRVLLR